jgi:hypothetical protein
VLRSDNIVPAAGTSLVTAGANAAEIQMDPFQAGDLIEHLRSVMPWYYGIIDKLAPGVIASYIDWQVTCSAASATACANKRQDADALKTKGLMRLGLLSLALSGAGFLAYKHVKRSGKPLLGLGRRR